MNPRPGYYIAELEAQVAAKDAEIARLKEALTTANGVVVCGTLKLNEARAAAESMRAKCQVIAKTFWLTYPFAEIADADLVCGLCEGIADAIATLKGEEGK